MSLLSRLVQQQAQVVLDKPQHAVLLVLLFAGLPILNWIALITIALITLRKGIQPGAQLTIIAILSTIIVNSFIIGFQQYEVLMSVQQFLPVLAAAYILKVFEKWNLSILFIIGMYAIFNLFINYEFNDIIQSILSNIKSLLQAYMQQEPQKLSVVIQNPELMQHIFIGAQSACLLISTTLILVCARYIQAILFYPEGFIPEMILFKSSAYFMPILIALFYLMKHQYYWPWLFLPMISIYYAFSALSLLLYFSPKNKLMLITTIILTLISFLPNILYPFTVIVGMLDSFINVRTRFSHKQSDAPLS